MRRIRPQNTFAYFIIALHKRRIVHNSSVTVLLAAASSPRPGHSGGPNIADVNARFRWLKEIFFTEAHVKPELMR